MRALLIGALLATTSCGYIEKLQQITMDAQAVLVEARKVSDAIAAADTDKSGDVSQGEWEEWVAAGGLTALGAALIGLWNALKKITRLKGDVFPEINALNERVATVEAVKVDKPAS